MELTHPGDSTDMGMAAAARLSLWLSVPSVSQ